MTALTLDIDTLRDITFKKFAGIPFTGIGSNANNNKPKDISVELAGSSLPLVFNNQVANQTVPDSAPTDFDSTITNANTNPDIIYINTSITYNHITKYKVKLKYQDGAYIYKGTSTTVGNIVENLLINAIPYNFDKGGSYRYYLYNGTSEIKASDATYPWYFDPKSGYLVFYKAPSGNVDNYTNLQFEFWRYEGTLGISSTSGTGITFTALTNMVANTAIGYNSLKYNIGGSSNTAFGVDSLHNTINGSYNTGIGFMTSSGNYSYSTAIGANATCIGDHQIMLGTKSESVVIPGDMKFLIDDVNIGCTISSSGVNSLSDKRYKSEIENISDAVETINKLQGVTFKMLDLEKRQMGFIAQDVKEIIPEVVHEDSKGYHSMSYDKIVALLVEGIKELSSELKLVKDELNELKKSLNNPIKDIT